MANKRVKRYEIAKRAKAFQLHLDAEKRRDEKRIAKGKRRYRAILEAKHRRLVTLHQDILGWEKARKLHFLSSDQVDVASSACSFGQKFSDDSLSREKKLSQILEYMEPNRQIDSILTKWVNKDADLSVVQEAFGEYFLKWAVEVRSPWLPVKKRKWYDLEKATRDKARILKGWIKWARKARENPHFWNAIKCGSIAAFYRLLTDLNREIEFVKRMDERNRKVKDKLEKGRHGNFKLNQLIVSLVNHLKDKTKSPHYQDIETLIYWGNTDSVFDIRECYRTGRNRAGREAEWFKELDKEVGDCGPLFEQKTPGMWPWYTDTLLIPMEVYKRGGLLELGAFRDTVEGKALLLHLRSDQMDKILDKLLRLKRDN